MKLRFNILKYKDCNNLNIITLIITFINLTKKIFLEVLKSRNPTIKQVYY
jgi:predicted transcriptional regulator